MTPGAARPARRFILLLCRATSLPLVLAGLAGCLREPAVDLSVPRRDFKPAEYEAVLKRWTRHRRIIKHFDTNLEVNVTHFSPEMVAAHAAAHAADYRLTRGERQRFVAKRLAEVQERHEFLMAATTADPAWNDFDRKESIWRLTLMDDKGTRVTPLSVTNLTITEVHRVHFPFVTVFHRLYHVLFPRKVGGRPFITPGSRWFKLIIASPLGSTELAWFVQASGHARPGSGLPQPDPEGRDRPQPTPAPRGASPHE